MDQSAIISSQKEQLSRYETRLKDVVNAYKGLLKEKEALKEALGSVSNNSKGGTEEKVDQNVDQKLTLMNSLATLSAEKSRLEQTFLLDKRNLKHEMTVKDKAIKELEEIIRTFESRSSLETENFKSKLIVEKHEREKEQTNSMLMIRELQMLLNDERHLKDNLEMQLCNLKTQFSQTSNSDRAIKELSQELDVNRKKIKQIEFRNNVGQDTTFVLEAFQKEILNLKQQHEVAICNEQKRALIAEERNKQLSVLHEERNANLESRLSELSNTIGSYDKNRQLDQESIFRLKEKIAQVSLNVPETSRKSQFNVHSIVEEIMQLKNTLLFENARLEYPIDISKIFVARSNSEDAYDKLKHDFEKLEIENTNLKKQITEQKENVNTLQEKVKVLNTNIEDYEQESRAKLAEHNNEIKTERNKCREITSAMEIDFRSKTCQLEQQIQKQRDRSLVLLEEKENELRALKASYEVFLPRIQSDLQQASFEDEEENQNGYSGASTRSSVQQSGLLNKLNSKETHIVHFFNELSRKDQELSNLRKSKIEIDNCLRQTLREKIMIQENLDEKIMDLEQQVDRLENNKSREGANLEYLKNVIISFLVSSDADDKRHMLNAIGAVLKFNLPEMESISNYFSSKK